MYLQTHSKKDLLLSYEMNAHPGEDLKQFWKSIHRFVLPLKKSLSPNTPFGIAPRVGRTLLSQLKHKKDRIEFGQSLADLGLFVFTLNAFPLEDFHAKSVKQKVYSPDWTQSERVKLTIQACQLLADIQPEGIVGSVSTSGGVYRGGKARDKKPSLRQQEKIAANYLRVIRKILALEQQSGKRVILTAEPEPDTTFESAEDVLEIAEGHMLPSINQCLAKPLGISRSMAEQKLRETFQVNLDVCHQAVLFRDPVAEWKKLKAAGWQVGKLHLTNALALRNPSRSPKAVKELKSFDEKRYLHQFAAQESKPNQALVRGSDLNELKDLQLIELSEIRCHFHVPLSKAKMGCLHTTREQSLAAMKYALKQENMPHWVIETYTWPLLLQGNASTKTQKQINGIRREYSWVINEAGLKSKPKG